MSKTSGSFMVCRYFTVDSLRLWFINIFLFVTDNYSGIHCRRLGLASIAFFGWAAQSHGMLRPPNPNPPHRLLQKFWRKGTRKYVWICWLLLLCAICAFEYRNFVLWDTLSFFTCCINSVSVIWVNVFFLKLDIFSGSEMADITCPEGNQEGLRLLRESLRKVQVSPGLKYVKIQGPGMSRG